MAFANDEAYFLIEHFIPFADGSLSIRDAELIAQIYPGSSAGAGDAILPGISSGGMIHHRGRRRR